MSYSMAYLDRAREYAALPPHGSPYSVALAGSELPDRSPVYRHWKSEHGLLDSLDPHVALPATLNPDRTEANSQAGPDGARNVRACR